MEFNNQDLNIDYHRQRLILKSLNTSDTILIASERCGISRKTMFNDMNRYNIVWDRNKKMYAVIPNGLK
jgi:hypothetical protein